jgi:hypothetical protein
VDGNVEILAVAFWKRKGSRDGQNMIPFAERQNADIAQLVEQVIRNDQVVGSNPTIGFSAPRADPRSIRTKNKTKRRLSPHKDHDQGCTAEPRCL